MKLFFFLCLIGITLASVRRDEYDNHTRRQHQLRTNQTPKKDRVSSGGGSVWDMIMVRGSNGQLESHADFVAEQRAIATGNEESAVCTDCMLVAKWIKIALKDGEKLEEYKGLLEMMCDYLPDDEKSICKNIVDNLPAYIHQLEPLLDNPRAFCQELSLCGSQQITLKPVGRKLLHLVAQRVENGRQPSNDVLCDECLFITKELKTIIENKETEDEVKNVVESVCSQLGSYQQQCKNLIDQYFPLAWSELEALLADGRDICNEVGMCQGSRHRVEMSHRRRQMMSLTPARGASLHSALPSRATPRLDSAKRFLRRIQTSGGTGAACLLCKIGLAQMLDYVRQHPKAVDKFEKLIRTEMCEKIVPSQYAGECNTFMLEYLQPAIAMVMEQLRADEVCDAWRLCSVHDLRTINHSEMSEELKASMLCQACTVVSEFLQHEASDSVLQSDVEHYLEQSCSQLPASMRDECKSMIEQYLPGAWQAAAEELNPMVICPQLHLCPASENALDQEEDSFEIEEKKEMEPDDSTETDF